MIRLKKVHELLL